MRALGRPTAFVFSIDDQPFAEGGAAHNISGVVRDLPRCRSSYSRDNRLVGPWSTHLRARFGTSMSARVPRITA